MKQNYPILAPWVLKIILIGIIRKRSDTSFTLSLSKLETKDLEQLEIKPIKTVLNTI